MDKYDIQRIENALWVLEKYINELDYTCVVMYKEGVKIDPYNGLEILNMAFKQLKEDNNNERQN